MAKFQFLLGLLLLLSLSIQVCVSAVSTCSGPILGASPDSSTAGAGTAQLQASVFLVSLRSSAPSFPAAEFKAAVADTLNIDCTRIRPTAVVFNPNNGINWGCKVTFYYNTTRANVINAGSLLVNRTRDGSLLKNLRLQSSFNEVTSASIAATDINYGYSPADSVPCVMTDWPSCDFCGPTTQLQARYVLQESQYGGSCGPLYRYANCNGWCNILRDWAKGLIAGLVVGFVLIVCLIVFCVWKRNRKQTAARKQLEQLQSAKSIDEPFDQIVKAHIDTQSYDDDHEGQQSMNQDDMMSSMDNITDTALVHLHVEEPQEINIVNVDVVEVSSHQVPLEAEDVPSQIPSQMPSMGDYVYGDDMSTAQPISTDEVIVDQQQMFDGQQVYFFDQPVDENGNPIDNATLLVDENGMIITTGPDIQYMLDDGTQFIDDGQFIVDELPVNTNDDGGYMLPHDLAPYEETQSIEVPADADADTDEAAIPDDNYREPSASASVGVPSAADEFDDLVAQPYYQTLSTSQPLEPAPEYEQTEPIDPSSQNSSSSSSSSSASASTSNKPRANVVRVHL